MSKLCCQVTLRVSSVLQQHLQMLLSALCGLTGKTPDSRYVPSNDFLFYNPQYLKLWMLKSTDSTLTGI